MPVKTRVKSHEYIRVLNNMGYDFRLNLCDDRVEVNGEPISDSLEKEIFTKLRDQGYYYVNIAENAWVAHARKNAYHPIKEYLNSLSYSGGNWIYDLSLYFDNPDGTFYPFLKRWLIGAVRRILQGGTQNRMLVLDGPQDIGKSKFVEWLVPHKLRGEHFKPGPISPDLKDHRIALMKIWVWEVAELGSTTRKADREALKYFLTLERVSERAAYARYEVQKPAMTSFIGTTNGGEAGLLSDPTGNRRFMFSKIQGIDWQSYTKDISVDDIWAEAQMLYYAGEPADLTPDEKKMAEQINEEYEIENPLEGTLMEYFNIDPTKTGWWAASADIARVLEDPAMGAYRGGTERLYQKLSDLMKTMGCEKVKRRKSGTSSPIWGYVGVMRKP